MKTGAVNLFAGVQASSSCECREARIYLQIEYDKAVPFALPRREQYMRQAERSRIYAEAESNASLLAIAEAQQYMWPPGQIYAEASNANLFAALQALSSFECRKALISPNGETSSNPFLHKSRRDHD